MNTLGTKIVNVSIILGRDLQDLLEVMLEIINLLNNYK